MKYKNRTDARSILKKRKEATDMQEDPLERIFDP